MATMNVSLPDDLKSWVEAKARGGGFAGSSDVIRDLIRRRQRYEEAVAEFERLVAEADAGGARSYTREELFEEVTGRRLGSGVQAE